MKKSSKITFIAIAAAVVIIIAAIVIAVVRMGSIESNLYGLWEREDDSGYTDSLALGDDGSVVLVYGSNEENEYQGTWEKGLSFAGTAKILLNVDISGSETEMVLYMVRYHGRYLLVTDKSDMTTRFTKVSDLSILDETTEAEQ